MIVCGIDVETTGLSPEKHRVIEVGAVLWDTATATPWKLYSELCYSEDLPEMEPEAVAAHGITLNKLREFGKEHSDVFKELHFLANAADAFVGHNCIAFDKLFYAAEMDRLEERPVDIPWIDTASDLKYPAAVTTRNLTHLAAEFGFLNPFRHRAIFDVLTMLRIFQNYDPVVAMEYAMQPMLTLQALVSFDDRQKAKDRGYRWNPDSKQWWKSCRESDAIVEIAAAGFKVVEIARVAA